VHRHPCRRRDEVHLLEQGQQLPGAFGPRLDQVDELEDLRGHRRVEIIEPDTRQGDAHRRAAATIPARITPPSTVTATPTRIVTAALRNAPSNEPTRSPNSRTAKFNCSPSRSTAATSR